MATGLTNVGGRMYIYLAKCSILLCSLLAKELARKRLLAETPMFERIAKARDDKYKESIKDAARRKLEAPQATCQVAVADPRDNLGLDADAVDELGLVADPPLPGGVPACNLDGNAKGKPNKNQPRIRRKTRITMSPSEENSLELAGKPDGNFGY